MRLIDTLHSMKREYIFKKKSYWNLGLIHGTFSIHKNVPQIIQMFFKLKKYIF